MTLNLNKQTEQTRYWRTTHIPVENQEVADLFPRRLADQQLRIEPSVSSAEKTPQTHSERTSENRVGEGGSD